MSIRTRYRNWLNNQKYMYEVNSWDIFHISVLQHDDRQMSLYKPLTLGDLQKSIANVASELAAGKNRLFCVICLLHYCISGFFCPAVFVSDAFYSTVDQGFFCVHPFSPMFARVSKSWKMRDCVNLTHSFIYDRFKLSRGFHK